MTYRDRLPQLDDGAFLTDGGLETVLIFHAGIDLPQFAAFTLLEDTDGREELRRYYEPYIDLARAHDTGFVLESPTWRASSRWAQELGYDAGRLAELNRDAIALMEELRESSGLSRPVVVSGNIGPQDDGYQPSQLLSADQAAEYHAEQIGTFADTAAEVVTAMTMTYADEAIGIANAAKSAGIPSVISFTVETDGRLPSGQSLGEAIREVDEATDGAPAYYMINCAHPTHFEGALGEDSGWQERVSGLRANASTMSHAELDEAETLDDGDPEDLGRRYAALRNALPNLSVLGGCCGTDHRHVAAIAATWLTPD